MLNRRDFFKGFIAAGITFGSVSAVFADTKIADGNDVDTDTKDFIKNRYTFRNFVKYPLNKAAIAAAMAVANNPVRVYNPVFIKGDIGLGKTHLLNAVKNQIQSKNKNAKVVYVTSEQFMSEFIAAIRFDKVYIFKEKYRSPDVLLFDDMHFLSEKERAQEEFFHTFRSLYESSKQIVVASTEYPEKIPKLDKKLMSQIGGGLVLEIQPPDFEARLAILKNKMERENIKLSEEVMLFIVGTIKTNIRALEGALIRLGAFSSITGKEITVDLTKEILKSTNNTI